MIRGRSRSLQNPFERAAAFYYGANNRVIAERTLRLADSVFARADATPANPSLYPTRSEEQSRRHGLNWGLNWGLIGGIVFSALCWWALFTFASPAIRSMLGFLSIATP
jgi:hypothetical protein